MFTPGQMAAMGGGGTNLQVNVSVQNNSDAKASVRSKKNASGGLDLVVLVEQIEGQIAGNVAEGRGALNSSLYNRFGLTPRFS